MPLLLPLALLSCGINKFDKQGNRKGKWKSYWNDQQIQAIGKYKKGWQKGIWKYYNINGDLEQVQVHRSDKTISITYFYPNGNIESKGEAKIVVDEKQNIQYYWYGIWTFYHLDGSIKNQKHYLEGQAMEEENLTK